MTSTSCQAAARFGSRCRPQEESFCLCEGEENDADVDAEANDADTGAEARQTTPPSLP